MERFNHYIERNGMYAKAYQAEGVEWCVDIENKGRMMGKVLVKGGILADEMGLGKTTQMIGLILSRFVRGTLIVLPRALLEQWNSIIKNTLGHKALVYHGRNAIDITVEQLAQSPVVLTTYGMLIQGKGKGKQQGKGKQGKDKQGKDKPLVLGKLHKVDWGRIVFDEAHHLRNRNTMNHNAAVVLRSECKWLVTGTPIQNSVTDFYGLCAVLGIEQPFYVNSDNMAVIARELIMKRTKKSVGIELPPLNKHIVEVEWESDEERRFAEDIHAHLEFSKATMREENPFKTTGLHHFAMLQRARQTCIDMSMLEKTVKDMVELGLMEETLIKNAMKYHSKRNKVIETIVERKDNNRAKLVFCHYRKEIDTVAKHLSEVGMKVAIFDGRTSRTERDKLLTDTTLDALILQIRTGCEGLNLQHFSEVYFISPNWNPAIEDQAVARCHRIGQQYVTEVFSFRMVAFDDEQNTRTMDMYTRDLQQVKRIKMKDLDRSANTEDGEKLEDNCPICLEDQHTNTCYKLECGHCFHSKCVSTWFQSNTTCPMCRRNE